MIAAGIVLLLCYLLVAQLSVSQASTQLWWCADGLPVFTDLQHGITFGIFFCTATVYSSKLAPLKLSATMQVGVVFRGGAGNTCHAGLLGFCVHCTHTILVINLMLTVPADSVVFGWFLPPA